MFSSSSARMRRPASVVTLPMRLTTIWLAAEQGSAAPVVGDVAEHAVLDLVPLARAGREVTDLHGQTQLVGQVLQLQSPQAHAVAVASSAVGRDQQTPRTGIQRTTHLQPPAPNALYGELCRVVVDAHADPALVGG